MKNFLSIFLILSSCYVLAQRGKDGANTVTVSAANTIVNQYTSLTANAINTSTLAVASSSAFSVGDLVFIIQMQGATVNAGRDTLFPDVNSSIPTNSSYGALTNYYAAGNYEFAQVNAIPNGTSISLDCQLTYSYVAAGKVQVVRVPRYTDLLITNAGSITCPNWNGNTGGVVVVEVSGNLTMNGAGSFSVTGKGFRGGAVITNTLSYIGGGNKYGSVLRQEGAYKGESIAGDTTRYRVYSGIYGRGAIANGGGGGCTHNAGGGGGANGGNIAAYSGFGNPASGFNTAWAVDGLITGTHTSSGGGKGGYTYSTSNQAVTLAPGSTNWGGDNRRNVGGLGGRPLDYSLGKLFLGGGGGAGHGNDSRASAGGNGGGMVFIQCYGNLSGSGTILADGANANNTTTSCSTNDGAGGGGGGGTIILNVAGTTNLTAVSALSARGGNGGNVNFNCTFSNNTAYGPGAGGGGGYIASNNTLPSINIAGGSNGIHTGNANNIGNNFPPNGATAGGVGSTGSSAIYTIFASANQTLCANQAFTVTATTNQPGASINWYNTIVGGSPIATGISYASPGYSVNGTYTLYAGYCNQGTYRVPVVLTVNSGLNISVNTASICSGQSATLTANPASAISYTWDSGANTNSIVVSPTVTTSYTVNALSGSCSGVQTSTVFVSVTPTVTVSDATICAGTSGSLSASGASSYTWNPGSLTTTGVVLTPTATIIYTVTGSNGGCTDTKTLQVTVSPTPTLSVGSTTICAGQTANFTASGANTYQWQPGSVSGSSYTIAPISNTTVQVIGTIGTCTSQTTASVTIGSNVSIAVNNPTICAGETTTISASGISTYTWSNGSNNSSITVSPSSTTVYTITGTAGTCNGTNTSTVTVNSVPTLTVTSAAVCSGETATISVSGASSYTWNPGLLSTNSVVLTPTATIIYTVTGSNGGCTDTRTLQVTVLPTPTLSVGSTTICAGQTATFTASGANTYQWQPGSVSGSSYTIAPGSNTTVQVIGTIGTCTSQTTASVTIGSNVSIAVNNPTICVGETTTISASGINTYTWSNGSNNSSITVSPNSTTVYTITGAAGTCSASNTSTVTVNSIPTLTATSVTICSGETATISVSGANTYTWSNGNQTNSQSLSPASSETFTIIGLSAEGCISLPVTTTISVNFTPTLSVNSPSICSGQSSTITVNGASSYTWSTGQNGNTIVVTPSVNSTYSIVGANGNCFNSINATVLVSQTPTIAAISASPGGCAPVCVTFINTPTNSNEIISYNFGDGNTSSSANPVHCYSVSGTYSTSVSITNTLSGCSSNYPISGPINIENIPIADFSFTNTNEIIVGDIIETTNTSVNSNTFDWLICGSQTSTLNTVSIATQDTGTCCVRLIARNINCVDTVIKCIKVEDNPKIEIPNVFTPNNDGNNDVFIIKGRSIKTFSCIIYDRWGLKIIELASVNTGWDGKLANGNFAADGTYFYIINYTDSKGVSKTEKGFLSLFRE